MKTETQKKRTFFRSGYLYLHIYEKQFLRIFSRVHLIKFKIYIIGAEFIGFLLIIGTSFSSISLML